MIIDLEAFEHKEIFTDCPNLWEALAKIGDYLSKERLGQIEAEVSDKAYLIHPESISIGKGSVVEAGAYIQGPCILGEHCTVRHGAYIRGNFLAGNHCMIGHCTEIKNCIFLNCAQAGHFAYLGDSIVGNNANLGAGFKCANLRLDRANIRINGVDTGRRKLGAIIGDGAQLGCNGVSNPGTIFAKGSRSYPCANVGGYVD